MYSLLFLVIISLILALALTPLCKRLAWHLGVVDYPDQQRKLHSAPVPRLGGVAILAAVLCSYGLLFALRLNSEFLIVAGLPVVWHILPALLLVFGIGLTDDIRGLPPWVKLLAEVVAAILVWSAGIHVTSIDSHSFPAPLSFIVTIGWIVGCTNAINLIDGVDGLATGVGLFAAVTMSLAALLNHNIAMALVAVPFVGALLGFLRFNFNPATIFLGDCGSLSVGFILGCTGAIWSEKSATLLGMTAPLLTLAVPLLDVGLSIIRRFVNNQNIFAADRSHIHHKMLAKGLTPRRVVLIVYGVCAISAAVSLLLTASHDLYRGFVIVLVCLAVWLGLQHLGYSEFDVAGRAIMNGSLRGMLSAEMSLNRFEQRLENESTLEKCAEILCATYPQFGFSGISISLRSLNLEQGSVTGWQALIDFPGTGHIRFWRSPHTEGNGSASSLFLDCVARIIDQRLNSNLSATEETLTHVQ